MFDISNIPSIFQRYPGPSIVRGRSRVEILALARDPKKSLATSIAEPPAVMAPAVEVPGGSRYVGAFEAATGICPVILLRSNGSFPF
jgi:hypothetical protein